MLPGNVVAERFEIERSAGSGGMGVVYRAIDRTNGQAVALKVLRQVGDAPADRFAREVELLSGLEHPHIVGYVTHGVTSEGLPFLVMPWLDGEDLQQRLRLGPLGVDETLTIAQCVADALATIHAQGLVHRDLKPSNLFLPRGSVGDVKLIDLGIARHVTPLRPMTVSGVLIGTPGYMAPEEARGDHVVAPAIDIFALGCVLHECLTGKPLFSGSHVMAVLAKIILEEAPRVRDLRRDVPEPLDAIIHRMVSKDPARRPRDGAELGQWLSGMWRVPPSARSTPLSMSLGASEQRVVTVLMAALPRVLAPSSDATDSTRRLRPNFEELSAASPRFGVRVHPLADGTAIALAPDDLSAADQASLLARFGKHVAELVPAASVAMATGMAVTGGRLPVGEAIERGVRIVRVAEPGRGVYVDDVSAALIASRFDVRREGEQLVVEDARHSLDATRPLLGRPTSCVGRDRELAILDATLAGCTDGGGASIVLVTAPPGTGKSRLRHEFVRRLRASTDGVPPMVLQCAGDPLYTTTPYAVIAQAVRHGAGLREDEPPNVTQRKLEEHVGARIPGNEATRVIEFLGELVGAPYDDETRLQLRAARESSSAMADQIRVAFEVLARTWCSAAPLVLVLEDLHWADRESMKLLDGVLRKLREAPLFVLALARPEVHERFPGLWAHRDVTEIHLPPLAERACIKIVRDAMGDATGTENVGRIVARSEGNAFFLEELIRAAVEGERSSDLPLSSRTRRFDALPESVIAVAQARLERLDTTSRRVLRAASVFGDVFWLEGVSALVGQQPSQVEPILSALIQHETIVPSEHSRLARSRELAFRHALLRGAAYATLTEDDRVLGHRLAATWLEDADEDREVVAMHWLEAGERSRAANSFAQAAETHWARAHADVAARCMVRSLLVSNAGEENVDAVATRIRLLGDALEATRGIDEGDVTNGLGRHVTLPARAGSSRVGVVQVAIERTLDVVRRWSDTKLVAESLARAGYALGALSDFPRARALLEEAASRVPHGARQPGVWMAAGQVALWQGDFGRVVDLLSKVDLSDGGRIQAETMLALATAEVAVNGRDSLAQSLDAVERAEQLVAVAKESPLYEVLCLKARFLCLYFAGEYARAAEVSRSAVDLAKRTGFRSEESLHLHNLGEQHIRLGDHAQARAALTASRELASDIGNQGQGHDEALLAYLDGVDGDAAAAGRITTTAERFRDAGDPWGELHSRYWLGRLLASSSDARARGELDRALTIAHGLKIRAYADDCAATIARIDS